MLAPYLLLLAVGLLVGGMGRRLPRLGTAVLALLIPIMLFILLGIWQDQNGQPGLLDRRFIFISSLHSVAALAGVLMGWIFLMERKRSH
jgi:hypothetical protein